MTALMDFAMVPPEVNSGLMYAGPGSAPTLAVAAAWNGLAAELRSTADSFGAVVANLSGEWEGPSAQAMAAAARPQLVWMTTAAAQAEQTAAQATAWAGAYDTAFAMTVPPPVIAANRALLASLIATNVFGQNTGAIMATEAQYEQMWAQDAAAMYGYAGSAAAAATLTPFAAPGSTAGATGASAQTTPSQLMSSVPAALQDLAAPAASSTSGAGPTTTGLAGLVDSIFGTDSPLGAALNSQFANTASSFGENGITALANSGSFFASLGQIAQSASQAAGTAGGAAADAAGAAGQAATGGLGGLGAVTANLGRGASLGRLSVPPTWAVNPSATPFEPPLGLTPLKTPNAYAEGMPGMPLPGSTPMRAPGRPEPDYGIRRLRFMARPVAAG